MELLLGIAGFLIILILLFLLEKFFNIAPFNKILSKKILGAGLAGFIIFFNLTGNQTTLVQKIGISLIAIVLILALNLNISAEKKQEKE